MNDALRQGLVEVLGPRFTDGPVPRIAPASERELAVCLRLLKDCKGRVHHDVEVSREGWGEVGPVELKSGTVAVGGGATLRAVESVASLAGWTLGPLSPGAWALDVASFLEGPYAGLRAVLGGHLDPVALAVTGMMPDGLVFSSHPSPRSAAGPDLDALFFGAGGRTGLVLGATLRLEPRPPVVRDAYYTFGDVKGLCAALFRALEQGCWLESARIGRHQERVLLHVRVAGTPEGVERDLSTFGNHVFSRGGRVEEVQVLAVSEVEKAEREMSWEGLAEVLAAGAVVAVYRLSLETVIAVGATRGGLDLAHELNWSTPAFHQLVSAVDPGWRLGGAP